MTLFTWPAMIGLLWAAGGVPAGTSAILTAGSLPAGWEPAGVAQTFGPDNLYEYIDGAAPGYLRYDFRQLTVQALQKAGDPKTQIAVERYEFGSHLDAFGIYSNERAPGLTFIKLGAQGYCVGPACRFYKGRYYVKLTAGRGDDASKAAEAAVAATIARRLRGETTPPAILGALPKLGLVAGSERYEGSDLLAHDFLGAGFTADYDLGGDKPSKLFFAVKDPPGAASDAYYQLLSFMRQRGEVGESLPLSGATLRAVRHPFYGPSVIGASGRIVCGVLRAPTPEAGVKLVAELLSRLSRVALPPPSVVKPAGAPGGPASGAGEP